MPIPFHKGVMALVAVTTAISAGSAMAETQEVLILDEVFFPAVIYVQAGDELLFINESDRERTITGKDDVWTSGPLQLGGTYTYAVDASSPLTFTSLFKNADDGSAVTFEGQLTFDAPPLSE